MERTKLDLMTQKRVEHLAADTEKRLSEIIDPNSGNDLGPLFARTIAADCASLSIHLRQSQWLGEALKISSEASRLVEAADQILFSTAPEGRSDEERVHWHELYGFDGGLYQPPTERDKAAFIGAAVGLRDSLQSLRKTLKPSPVCPHGKDFRSLRWNEQLFSFTAAQAAVVKMLYENWCNGTPDVGDETLLSAVDPEAPPARLNVLFRSHPAWKVIIVQGDTKGTHRLSGEPT